MNYTEHQILLFFLIFVRFTSMFLAAPVFGVRGIPIILKIGLGAVSALIVFPVVNRYSPDLEFTLIGATILVFGEIFTGFTIGIVINFLFSGVEFAGEYIGVDMGLSIAQEFDPLFNQQISVIARLKNILAVLIFLLIMRISASVFVIGVKIAAPAIITLFLTSVAMGITARAVPQMNIFFVGFPLRIAAGFLSLIMAFPLFLYVFKKLLVGFESDVFYLLKVM